MAGKKAEDDRVDPTWPEAPDGKSPVSELASDRQGSLSPFGDLTFPMPQDSVSYEHPVTEINK
ncbi:hypothetical protein FHX42_004090 [Saccharopolyspora lacisalsi]|uniref:Uncharacterized protein n=1 Tax=Halosaccharopolyspora lacisalsi TaxID=1000566 RepID=A0A839E5W3_9PSEU|nr:hypothetical protein [Halosaccharopolyspora lacisalsi]